VAATARTLDRDRPAAPDSPAVSALWSSAFCGRRGQNGGHDFIFNIKIENRK